MFGMIECFAFCLHSQHKASVGINRPGYVSMFLLSVYALLELYGLYLIVIGQSMKPEFYRGRREVLRTTRIISIFTSRDTTIHTTQLWSWI